MASSSGRASCVGVICVGGPTKGTRFRPLSMCVPKPLFPIGGRPMVEHAVRAFVELAKSDGGPQLHGIYVIGFFREDVFSGFADALGDELGVRIEYLQEVDEMGSGGCLLHFAEIIERGDPDCILMVNSDVCSSFPLRELVESHLKNGGLGTMLVKRAAGGALYDATEFGNAICDAEERLLHYTDKPETRVGDLINSGVYAFSRRIFDHIRLFIESKAALSSPRTGAPGNTQGADYARIDDIFVALAGKNACSDDQLFVHTSSGFWEKVKTPGFALKCSSMYLDRYRETEPAMLADHSSAECPNISGNVHVHGSAYVHRDAFIGPNVSIAAGVCVGAGARLRDCIVLEDVKISEHACVRQAILGWRSKLGKWSRVEGAGRYSDRLGVSILGESVVVQDEGIVVNCIVLPNKTLSGTSRGDIIL